MKKFLKIIFFSFILLNFSFVNANFKDIENNIYKNYILDLAEKNVINTENENFEPNRNISRAEFLAILMGITKTELQKEESCFSDVSENDWFSKYVCTGKNLGFFSGYEDNSFKPQNSITMPEAYAMATKAFNLEIKETNSKSWEEKYHNFIIEKGIFTENITKNRPIKRSEVAKLLSVLNGKENNLEIEVKNSSNGCFIEQKAETGKKQISVAGKNRTYYINFPKNFDPKKEYKLLFAFHGKTVGADLVRTYMGLGNLGKGGNENYITVYPYGLGNGPYSWHETENLEFFDKLLEKIQDENCIDSSKIFVVGHSLGGYMSNRLACLRGEKINSVVTVAGTDFTKGCVGNPSSAQFHLPNDHLVRYGNTSLQINFLKKSYNTTKEANVNLGGTNCKIFTGENEKEVVLCNSYKTMLNDPHGWPVNGGKMIFDFFERQK